MCSLRKLIVTLFTLLTAAFAVGAGPSAAATIKGARLVQVCGVSGRCGGASTSSVAILRFEND